MTVSEARLISVIIPCYNQARYLGEAINSVNDQAYSNLEVIVVDDGSTDETPEVAARYSQVKCIRQENQGLAAARNRGVEASRGEYVVFLDADDRLVRGAIEVGADSLDSHPDCAFVSGHYSLINAEGQTIPHRASACAEGDYYSALLRRNYIGMHATVMYRRSALEIVGGFDTSRQACEDYDLYLRIARSFPIRCHHRLVAEYRQHGGNMSRDYALMMRSSLSVLRSQWEFVRGDEKLEHAYGEGIKFWQDYCATGLIRQVKNCLGLREWRNALVGSLTLLRHHPQAFTHRVAPGLMRKAFKRAALLSSRFSFMR
ncbi:MAG TPA: glycosyltransferase [Blastocatellia bacterium]|nr:glycosyltransferase [Blastocatellia bacterium]